MKNKIEIEEISAEIVEKYKNKSDDIKDINAKFVDSFSNTISVNNTNKSTNAVIKDHHPIDSRSLDDLMVVTDNSNKIISTRVDKSIENIILDYINNDGYEKFKKIIRTEYEYNKMHNLGINENLERLYNNLERN